MKLGVFSNTVGGGSPEQVAERSRHLGIEAVQLRLEWPGLDLLVSAVDRARVRRAYESHVYSPPLRGTCRTATG